MNLVPLSRSWFYRQSPRWSFSGHQLISAAHQCSLSAPCPSAQVSGLTSWSEWSAGWCSWSRRSRSGQAFRWCCGCLSRDLCGSPSQTRPEQATFPMKILFSFRSVIGSVPVRLPPGCFFINIRKCGADFVYLKEGSGKTWQKIDWNNPHTCIVGCRVHASGYRWRCCRLPFCLWKLPDFLWRIVRKHFHQYVCFGHSRQNVTKVGIFSDLAAPFVEIVSAKILRTLIKQLLFRRTFGPPGRQKWAEVLPDGSSLHSSATKKASSVAEHRN